MKNLHPNPFINYLRSIIYITGTLLLHPYLLPAQLPITVVYTHNENAIASITYTGTGATGNASSGITANNYTYKYGRAVAATNNRTILDSLKANNLNYHYQQAVYSVKFRRVDNASVTGLRKSMRIEQTGGTVSNNGTVSLLPDYNDSLEQVYLQRTLNIGIDNLFQNAATTNNMNVERMDVVFPYGIKAANNSGAGFAVFDWGAAGGHDPLYIAAIKTIDASGNPSSYYTPVAVTAASYGSNVVGSGTYVILRKNATDNRLLLMNNSTDQTRDGAFLRLADLAVPNNAFTYGYSLFAPDVNISSVNNLVSFTNAANFPTNSDLSGGGFDPLAVTGLWVLNSTFIVLQTQEEQFTATALEGTINLKWNLVSNGGITGQIIERSSDGLYFDPILHLPANTTGWQSAADLHPLAGMNYYRLKLLKQDGSFTVSAVSAAQLSAPGLSLEISPNPVNNKTIHLTLQAPEALPYIILISDMQGRILHRQQLPVGHLIQTDVTPGTNITTGYYTLALMDKQGRQILKRRVFIK